MTELSNNKSSSATERSPDPRVLGQRGWKILMAILNDKEAGWLGGDEKDEPKITTQPAELLNIDPPFKMPADKVALEKVLCEIADRKSLSDHTRKRLSQDILTYFTSGLGSARSCDRVSIILLGGTGQGKSSTINKLTGKMVLKTGRNKSTTKGIESVGVIASHNGIEVGLWFDDTPGFVDTSASDRKKNEDKLAHYCYQIYSNPRIRNIRNEFFRLLSGLDPSLDTTPLRSLFRKGRFPNAILLVSTWRDTKHEECETPEEFVSGLGKAIMAMKRHALYDAESPNVIVVITRSITDPASDLAGNINSRRFIKEWKKEANEKRVIVAKIQELAYRTDDPASTPATLWPVVFIENGKEDEFSMYFNLPNGEQSHQNLFNALRAMFGHEGESEVKDLLGLHALRSVISGDMQHAEGEITTALHVQPEFELKRSKDERSPPTDGPPFDQWNAIKGAASEYIGHGFNPVLNRFTADSIINFDGDYSVKEAINNTFDTISLIAPLETSAKIRITTPQLTLDCEIRARREDNGLPYTAYKAANKTSKILEVCKPVAQVGLPSALPELTPKILDSLLDLPPWGAGDDPARMAYGEFFELHGTHIVVSASLGGKLHVDLGQQSRLGGSPVEAILRSGPSIYQKGSARRPIHSDPRNSTVQINCMGGDLMHTTMESVVKQLILRPETISQDEWESVKSRWIDALVEDPVLLSHLPETRLIWLCYSEGIDDETRDDLFKASQWYLEDGQLQPKRTLEVKGVASSSASTMQPLDRRANVQAVDKDLKKGQRGCWDSMKCVIF